jgi:hypothetical protein
MLASLNSQHPLGSAVGLNTLKPPYSLLCGFSLLPESWLCLPTIAALLPIIASLSFPFLSWVTLWGWCLPHFLQKVLRVLGTWTIFAVELCAQWKRKMWRARSSSCAALAYRNKAAVFLVIKIFCFLKDPFCYLIASFSVSVSFSVFSVRCFQRIYQYPYWNFSHLCIVSASSELLSLVFGSSSSMSEEFVRSLVRPAFCPWLERDKKLIGGIEHTARSPQF